MILKGQKSAQGQNIVACLLSHLQLLIKQPMPTIIRLSLNSAL